MDGTSQINAIEPQNRPLAATAVDHEDYCAVARRLSRGLAARASFQNTGREAYGAESPRLPPSIACRLSGGL